MSGMNKNTGRAIANIDHLRQSIADIITTPLGSRVMRRDYGCLVPALIDQPDNQPTRARLAAAVASSLMRWEPRVTITRVQIARNLETPGQSTVNLAMTIDMGRRAAPLTLSIPVQGRAA